MQPLNAAASPDATALVERLQSSQHSLDTHSALGDVTLVAADFSPTPKRRAEQRTEQWVMQLGSELPKLIRPDGVSLCIDYRKGKPGYRAAQTNRAQQPLARALGIAKLSETERNQWHIVDGTAGAGADGWQLAAAGANVTLVEQHPVLFTMLQHAVQAALIHGPSHSIARRVGVVSNTIENALANDQGFKFGQANALYLDPMYPPRRSTAAVKKPMQFIQALVGSGPDPVTMLERCLGALDKPELQRVVVKRPSEAEALISASVWRGQLVSVDAGAARFDVYLKPA